MSAPGRGSSGRLEVEIDCFPSAAAAYHDGYAIVAVDVLRATTTAITAVSSGRRCYLAPTLAAASVLATALVDPLMAGEIGGSMPVGFEMDNSPAEMAKRTDVHRPAVLVTSSGTRLIHNAEPCGVVYVACLRNMNATVAHLVGRHERIAVIGAGSRGEFREEDQACCAEVARLLIERGYTAGNDRTSAIVQRWSGVEPDAWLVSNSVNYLLRTDRKADLDFVLDHRDDLDEAYRVSEAEIVAVGPRSSLETGVGSRRAGVLSMGGRAS